MRQTQSRHLAEKFSQLPDGLKFNFQHSPLSVGFPQGRPLLGGRFEFFFLLGGGEGGVRGARKGAGVGFFY